jgi:hypothetical protein
MSHPRNTRIARAVVRAHGRDLEFAKAGGQYRRIRAAWHDAFVEFDLAGTPLETSSPTAWFEDAVVPSVEHGDRVRVDGREYVAQSVQPDGRGLTVVRFHALG